jgi:hypothetical protein
MPLSHDDWREIQRLITSMVSQQGETFTQGKVVKSDQQKKLVWLKEFGDQPIPCIAFDYSVKYYYEDASGNLIPRKTNAYSKEVEMLVPRVGEIVLVARHMGSRRLPKCLGVIQSTGYVRDGGD